MLTYDTWEEPAITFPEDDSYKGALSVLKWAYGHYGDQLVYACGFGIEGIVLIDLISKVKKDAEIVFLDTGLHFKETYETIEKVKERYPGLNIILKKPSLTLEEQAEAHGDKLWEREPNQCRLHQKNSAVKRSARGASGMAVRSSPGSRAEPGEYEFPE